MVWSSAVRPGCNARPDFESAIFGTIGGIIKDLSLVVPDTPGAGVQLGATGYEWSMTGEQRRLGMISAND